MVDTFILCTKRQGQWDLFVFLGTLVSKGLYRTGGATLKMSSTLVKSSLLEGYIYRQRDTEKIYIVFLPTFQALPHVGP